MAKQPELNLVQFIDKYGTEEKCMAHLFKHKWFNGYICEKCGSVEYYQIKLVAHMNVNTVIIKHP